MGAFVSITTVWGAEHGGINTFNVDLCEALAEAVEAPVVCIVAEAKMDQQRDAADRGVRLIDLAIPGPPDKLTAEHFPYLQAALAREKIDVDWWLGHDIVSGGLAREAATRVHGKYAIVVHTAPAAYKTLTSDDPTRALTDGKVQASLVRDAQVVFAVGPKLAKAALDLMPPRPGEEPRTIVPLVPGLARIDRRVAPNTFHAITFGRLGGRADRLKQSRLAAAAFGAAQRGPLLLGSDAQLTVVGLDDTTKDGAVLNEIASREANRSMGVHPRLYERDRGALFASLAEKSAALMLSLHEGFGLAAWEGIAAAVPVIVSRNSGVFDLIREELGEAGTRCVHAIDVRGPSDDSDYHPSDVGAVAEALGEIAEDATGARDDAVRLLSLLRGKEFTWSAMAHHIAGECGLSPRAPETDRSASKGDQMLAVTVPMRDDDTDLGAVLAFREDVAGLFLLEDEQKLLRRRGPRLPLGSQTSDPEQRRMAVQQAEARYATVRRRVVERLERMKRLAATHRVGIALSYRYPPGYRTPATFFDAVLERKSRKDFPPSRVLDAIDHLVGACRNPLPSVATPEPRPESRDLRGARLSDAKPPVARPSSWMQYWLALAATAIVLAAMTWALQAFFRGRPAPTSGECLVHSPYRGREYIREREEIAERGAVLLPDAPRDFILLYRGTLQRPGADPGAPQRIFRVRETHSGIEGWVFLERAEVEPTCPSFWTP